VRSGGLSLARATTSKLGTEDSINLGISEGWGTMWWDQIITTSAYTDAKLYLGPYLDMEDKFKDCFDAFLEFQDNFRRCQQLPGLVMHFTLFCIASNHQTDTRSVGLCYRGRKQLHVGPD
jgi:hypothetical protein